MAADGQIVLGLNISGTTSQINADLRTVLNGVGVKQLVLKAAIEKSEVEKAVSALVKQINSETAKIGVVVNERDVSKVLTQQQKIASVQKELIQQMERYKQVASDVGLVLSKTSQNAFKSAINTNNFKLAQESLKSVKKEIESYNSAIKSMNGDTKLDFNIQSIQGKFSSLKTQTESITQLFNNLYAAQQKFGNATTNSQKLAYYNKLKQILAQLDVEYKAIKQSETTSMSNSSILKKIRDMDTYVKNLKTTYATIGDSAGAEKLKAAILDLDAVLLQVNRNATGGALSSEWQRISEKVNQAKRAVSEFKTEESILSGNASTIDAVAQKVQTLKNNIANSNISGEGITNLTNQLSVLSVKSDELRIRLSNLDPTNGEDVKSLTQDVERLKTNFDELSKSGANAFKDTASIQKFIDNMAKARQKVSEYDSTYSAIKSRPELVQELERLKQAANSISTPAELKKFNAEFSAFDSRVIQAGAHCKSFGDQLKIAFRHFSVFFSASRVIYRIIGFFKQMVSNVIHLNSAMVELRKVTDATSKEFDTFLTNAKSKAVELGSTVVDLVNATADFSRLGYTLKEAEELGRVATIYLNVGDDVNTIDKATSSLISTMKGFGIEAEDSMSIIDKFNEVGNNFAISSGGIGDALQRSAAALSEANNTIDESIALIVSANNVIQNPETVGTMWKTVSMRIRGAKADLEEAGLETEAMAESTASLRKQILALTNVDGTGGFDIMLDENTFKSTYDIMLGIGQIWQNIADIDQAALLELLAGKRQGNALAATLANLDDLQNALTVSEESAGSAMREQEIWMESLKAKINQFKAAFEALSGTVFSDDFLGGVIDSGTELITILDNIITSLGGIGNSLLVLITIIAALNFTKTVSLVQSFWGSLKIGFGLLPKLTSLFGNLTTAWAMGKASGGGFIATLKGATSALITTSSAASIATAAIMGVVAVIAIAVIAYQNWKRKQEENRQMLIEEGQAAVESSNKITELVSAYLELSGAADNGAASTEDLANAQDEVIAALGLTGRSVRELTDEYGSLKNAIIAVGTSQLKTNISSAIAGANASKEQVESDLKTGLFGGNAKSFSSTGDEAEEIMSYLKSLGYVDIDNTGGTGGGTIFLPSVRLTGGDSSKATFEDLMADYTYLKQMMDDISSKFGAENDLFNQVSTLYGIYNDKISSTIDQINQANSAIAQELILSAQTDKIPQTTEEYLNIRKELISDLANNINWDESGSYSAEGLIDSLLLENAAFKEIARQVAEEEVTAAEIKEKRDSVAKALAQNNYSDLTSGTSAFSHAMGEHVTKILELRDKLETLSDEDLSIAYNLISVPENGIDSWEELIAEIDKYKNGTSDILSVSDQLRDSLQTLWSSETFKDSKKALLEMASTLDGITPNAIEELASESESLAAILKTDGMNAQFLANILQTVADGGDGFALITNDALTLNEALHGMRDRFDEVTNAKSRYDTAMSIPEKDADFKSYAEAFKELNEQFEAGTTNSNAFWAAAEFLFGADQLQEWGWSDGLDEIYASMKKNVDVFGDADSAGEGFLDRLYELSEAGEIKADDGSVIGQIEKLSDGTYDFNFDSANLDAMAEKLGITSEAAIACMQALSMYGDFNFYDINAVMGAVKKIGLSSDALNGTAVNVSALTDQLISLGYTNKEIYDLLSVLREVDGVTLLDANANVGTLTQSLSDLGLAAQDGVNVTVNADGLSNLMSQLNFTKDDTQNLITKLSEADGITLTNAAGEVINLNDALEHTNELQFAGVTSELDGITDSAELAQTKVEALQVSIDKLTGKTVTVTLDIQRKSGILGSILGYANGTDGAPEGDALVGEEGEELIQSGDHAYVAGTNGAEIVHLNKGDKVYTADETKRIKRDAKIVRGVVPAFAGGTGLGKSDKNKYPSVLPDSSKSKSTSSNTSKSTSANDTSSSTSKAESEFERLYKYHQHLLNMDRESISNYLKWLDSAYKEAYKNGEIELDDYYKYEEEVFEKIKSILDDNRKEHENAITLTENFLDNAIANGDRVRITQYTSEIVNHYRAMQDELHQQAEYYRSLGYSDTSDEVSNLSNMWWDYYDEIKNISTEAWQQIVDNANDALDSITGLYDTLKSAAQEYAESGKLNVDTLQEICSLGIENLSYLSDENGQLVINAQRIQQVIAARTQQMAIESALNYVQQLRQAVMNNDAAALLNLTTATSAAANSTWDLVYAQLQLLGLNSDQYRNALNRINALRSLTDVTVSGIGKVDGATKKAIESQSDALEDLLKYVQDMIKQEVENQIGALEKQIDSYKEIVDLQKKSLDLEREKDKYTKNVANKEEEIANLRKQIYTLDLDDSREAAAQKAKLQEELSEKINDLAEYQSDHAYDAASDMLDKMADAYEDEKNTEINLLKNTISSEEKLYQLAISRISNHWDTLYQDLINWNYEYGSVTSDELTSAWDIASQSVQQYGSYLDAVLATQRQISSFEAGSYDNNTSLGDMGDFDASGGNTMAQIKEIVQQMKSNSAAHYSADTTGKARLNKANLELGAQLAGLIGRAVKRGDDGVWYLDRVGGAQLYSTYPYSAYHTGGIAGDKPDLKQNEIFAKLEKSEAIFTEPQQDTLWKIIDFQDTMFAKYGKLFNTASDSGMMGDKLQTLIKKDAQQVQNVVDNTNYNITITAPVQVYPMQKLNDSEVKQLSKKISDNTITRINDAFAKKGKLSTKNILKP